MVQNYNKLNYLKTEQ